MPIPMKCPVGYKLYLPYKKCMTESTLKKMGFVCPAKDIFEYDSLEIYDDRRRNFNLNQQPKRQVDDFVKDINNYPELIEHEEGSDISEIDIRNGFFKRGQQHFLS